MFYKLKVEWDVQDEDVNDGYLWGIEYWNVTDVDEMDEDWEFVDAEWFQSKEERDNRYASITSQFKEGTSPKIS
jgi:hypothetical protein